MSDLKFRCECGCSKFHTFFKYKGKDIERIRCFTCGKEYERNGSDYKEFKLDAVLKYTNMALVKDGEKIEANKTKKYAQFTIRNKG